MCFFLNRGSPTAHFIVIASHALTRTDMQQAGFRQDHYFTRRKDLYLSLPPSLPHTKPNFVRSIIVRENQILLTITGTGVKCCVWLRISELEGSSGRMGLRAVWTRLFGSNKGVLQDLWSVARSDGWGAQQQYCMRISGP